LPSKEMRNIAYVCAPLTFYLYLFSVIFLSYKK
jgi:hypothetical protein